MSTLNFKNKFEEIYEKTYADILKYIICRCNNLEDANDILQDTYVELYKMLTVKKNIHNEKAFLIGIAKNRLKNYYASKSRNKTITIFTTKEDEDVILDIWDNINLEEEIVTKDNVEQIWNYLNERNIVIAKVFYLHYCLDMKLSDIAKELHIKESNVKNYIYRTLKELQNFFGKGDKLNG